MGATEGQDRPQRHAAPNRQTNKKKNREKTKNSNFSSRKNQTTEKIKIGETENQMGPAATKKIKKTKKSEYSENLGYTKNELRVPDSNQKNSQVDEHTQNDEISISGGVRRTVNISTVFHRNQRGVQRERAQSNLREDTRNSRHRSNTSEMTEKGREHPKRKNKKQKRKRQPKDRQMQRTMYTPSRLFDTVPPKSLGGSKTRSSRDARAVTKKKAEQKSASQTEHRDQPRRGGFNP